ncbi:hypothetical protein NLJ89_g8489 [Agrocybe chaxingu]|uniref:Nephrocystin 3-like N-terminal domain-containing protein n=1 Tax=Agrocybe chaxingu TaxID=84603 RepID=A0A9W8JUS9_9AGAR|nr:hypothetical protein NLJ89_g8489 [Agrocybe chaxingu]
MSVPEMDLLLRHSALAALFNANEPADQPKCDPATRLAIINKMMMWIAADNFEEHVTSMLWLNGPAGAGKTALGKTIAELCKSDRRLLGTFFFSRTMAGRSDGDTLIPTLAYQLILSLPFTRRYILQEIKCDPGIFQQDTATQLQRLIRPISRDSFAQDPNADFDIRTFLYNQFDNIREMHPEITGVWPISSDIDRLVEKASGQFIYAKAVVDYLKTEDNAPDERLQIVLGLSPPPSNDSPFPNLYQLYYHIFSSSRNREATMEVVSILILPRINEHPLSRNYTSPAMLERLLWLNPGDVRRRLVGLLSLFTLSGPEEPIRILHASLPDFLFDPSRSRDFFVDPLSARRVLGRLYLRAIRRFRRAPRRVEELWRSLLLPALTHCAAGECEKELFNLFKELDFSSLYRESISYYPWQAVAAETALDTISKYNDNERFMPSPQVKLTHVRYEGSRPDSPAVVFAAGLRREFLYLKQLFGINEDDASVNEECDDWEPNAPPLIPIVEIYPIPGLGWVRRLLPHKYPFSFEDGGLTMEEMQNDLRTTCHHEAYTNTASHRPANLDSPRQEVDPLQGLYIQAHEADVVRGPTARAAAESLEVVEYQRDGTRWIAVPKRGSALIRVGGETDARYGRSLSTEDDEDPVAGPANDDKLVVMEGMWVDRYDARLLLDSLPASTPRAGTTLTSTMAPPDSPTGWSDLPSDSEDTFFLNPDEVEDFQREKRRRELEKVREERLKARMEEDGAGQPAPAEDIWGASDEEPDETVRQLIERTAVHILSSPNPAQLEMKILANHGADKRFAFLRGRWSRAWNLAKAKARLQKEKEKEAQKPPGIGLLAGYGSDWDESGGEEDGDKEAEAKPAAEVIATAEVDEEAAKEARRKRLKEWTEKRRTAAS